MTRRNRRSRETGENAATSADASRASGGGDGPATADDQATIAEALRESERRYRSLFDHLLNGYAHCRMILDEHGRPVDFVYQSVNAAFERLTGLKDVAGKPVSETIPGLRESSPELFASYARVAASGESETFEVELESLGMWFLISAYSTEPGYFDAVFENITERKRAEAEIRRLNDELEEQMLTRTAQLEASNQENDELVNETVALVEDNAAITRLAETDVLTGLGNRRHFHEALEKSVSFARRHRSPLAVVSLDLDGLKAVNDTAGHEAGDEVLASFASLLAALCRAEDLPARLGGDEFSVLLPGIELGGALGLAERVLAAVRSCADLAERDVTASAGVAAWKADELPNDLLRRADEALYAAKSCGGDSVVGHD